MQLAYFLLFVIVGLIWLLYVCTKGLFETVVNPVDRVPVPNQFLIQSEVTTFNVMPAKRKPRSVSKKYDYSALTPFCIPREEFKNFPDVEKIVATVLKQHAPASFTIKTLKANKRDPFTKVSAIHFVDINKQVYCSYEVDTWNSDTGGYHNSIRSITFYENEIAFAVHSTKVLDNSDNGESIQSFKLN